MTSSDYSHKSAPALADALVSDILSKLYVVSSVESVNSLVTGPDSQGWRATVVSDDIRQTWFLKRHRSKNIDRIRRELAIQKSMARAGCFLIPDVVPARDGSLVVECYGKCFSVCLWVQSDRPFDWTACAWSSTQARAAGAALAQFHAYALSSFEADDPDLNADSSLTDIPGWGASLIEQASTAAELEPGDSILRAICANRQRLLHNLTELLAVAVGKPGGVSNYLLHGDYHPGNVLFLGNDVAAIVDFDYLKLGDPMYDIGYGAYTFSQRWGTGRSDSEMLSSFVNGYNEQAFTCGDRPVLPKPTSTTDLEPWLRLTALLVFLWLLELYLQAPQQRQRIRPPLEDSLNMALLAP